MGFTFLTKTLKLASCGEGIQLHGFLCHFTVRVLWAKRRDIFLKNGKRFFENVRLPPAAVQTKHFKGFTFLHDIICFRSFGCSIVCIVIDYF